jgi:ubiquinone/menaquinone biosynthesis C-methylase UbiE
MVDTYDGQKVYNPWVLRIYDFYVVFLSNKFVWGCSANKQLAQYKELISENHLDVGVGSGYYLSKTLNNNQSSHIKITLMDLNQNSLHFAAKRIKNLDPKLIKTDIMQPLSSEITAQKYDSIGLNFLLHCLPGTMDDKSIVFKNIADLLEPNGNCFGSTIINDYKNVKASKLANIYNKKGIFSNKQDTYQSLEQNLKQYFSNVKLKQIGSVVLFQATK